MASRLAFVLQALSNRVLRLDPEGRDRLAALEGKAIQLQLSGGDERPALAFFFLPSAEGLRVQSQCDREPDVVLRGTWPALLRLVRAAPPGAVAGTGGVAISGDVELAERLRRILADLDPDWEELASRYLGDVAAHQLGNAVRRFRTWGAQARESLGQDLAEYLQAERRLLPRRAQVDAFVEAVDLLRADADRLAARLRRLEAGR